MANSLNLSEVTARDIYVEARATSARFRRLKVSNAQWMETANISRGIDLLIEMAYALMPEDQKTEFPK